MAKTFELYLKDARDVEHTFLVFSFGGHIEEIEIYSEAVDSWIQIVEPLNIPENKEQLANYKRLKEHCQDKVDMWLIENRDDILNWNGIV